MPISNLFEFALKCVAVFCVLNILLYFIELPIWEQYRKYFGRVSIGYPTTDVVLLGLSYASVLFNKNINIRYITRLVLLIGVPLNIILMSSGTGLIILLFITAYYFINRIRRITFDFVIKLCIIVLSIYFVGTGVINYVAKNYTDLYVQFNFLVENKIDTILGNTDDKDVNTMKTRENQFKEAMEQNVDSGFKAIFGIGFSRLRMGVDDDEHNYIQIENQYGNIIVGMGYIGVILFVFFLVGNIYTCAKYGGNICEIIAVNIVFALGCCTNILLASYTIASYLALYYSYIVLSYNHLGKKTILGFRIRNKHYTVQ